MDDPSNITVMVLLFIFSVCGTLGNSLVLYIYSHKKEKSTAGIFIMSLAGTDLFTCLFLIPYTEVVIYLDYKLLYDVACKIYMFFITCNIPFAAFIMVAIAIDRYFCICHPFLHALNIKRAKIIVLCLLAAASSFGIITALMHGVYTFGNPNGSTMNNVSDTKLGGNSTYFSGVDLSGDNESLFNYSHHTNNNTIETNSSTLNVSQSKCAQNVSCVSSKATNLSSLPTDIEQQEQQEQQSDSLIFTGICMPNHMIIGPEYVKLYQTMYAGTYLVSFFVVVILYGLIYKSIHEHRAKRNKRKRSSLYPTGVEFSNVETQFTAVTHVNPHKRNSAENGDVENTNELQPMRPKPRNNNKALSIKEKTLIANIRTAAMLFAVTVVFLIAFLPAWLMAYQLLDYNQVIFYMYFVYHAANPFIYAFMNKSFRDDLEKVLKCQSMPMVR